MEQQQQQFSIQVTNKKNIITDDDRKRLLELFQKFNHLNIWSNVKNFDDFHVNRFESGNINDICLCELSDKFCQQQQQQQLFNNGVFIKKIVVKCFNTDQWLPCDPMERAIIITLISMKGFSPKLLYIDDKYQVDEYIEGRHYNYDDDCDQNTVLQMARLIAQIHSINPVPVSRKGWETFLLQAKDKDNEMAKIICENKIHLQMIEKNPEFKEKYFDIISTINFDEIEILTKQTFEKLQSPLVLSHNDLNRQNRLVKIDNNGNGNDNGKRIYLIDLDYANYNLRGFDMGRYFSNYRHKYDDMFGNEGFPNDQEMDIFLNEYRNEFIKNINQKDKNEWLNDEKNSLQYLRDETKLFTLLAYSFDVFFCLIMFVNDNKSDKFLKFGKSRQEGYLKLKQRFTDDGTFERIFGFKII